LQADTCRTRFFVCIGRVREGKCFKLISRATFDKLKDHTAPEISRCALDQTLLSLLFLGAEDGSGRFLQKLLDPPSAKSVKSAASSLRKLGALEQPDANTMKLTPLGMHLAGIPAPPTIGKLLVMGCILGCRNGGIAMAAALSVGRSPLLRIDNPRNGDDSADKSRNILKERAKLMEQCGNSDHAMLATLFTTWQGLDTGDGKRKRYCDEIGLSFNGMKEIAQLASQYDTSLSSSGFSTTPASEKNSQSWRVLRTCAVASMAPDQLVKVVRPSTKYHDTAEGARLKDGEAKEHKFFIRIDNDDDLKKDRSVDSQPKDERVFIVSGRWFADDWETMIPYCSNRRFSMIS
jgi:HrpA-like RNA helicase